MTVDLDYLKQIISVAKESGLSEIEVTEGERTYRCVIQPPSQPQSPSMPATPVAVKQKTEIVEKADCKAHTIKSPMVGTLYLSSAPGEPCYVTEGQSVKKGDVLCLIEAMKMFNKVKADRAGVIKSCLVQDSVSVEFDQVLFEIADA